MAVTLFFAVAIPIKKMNKQDIKSLQWRQNGGCIEAAYHRRTKL